MGTKVMLDVAIGSVAGFGAARVMDAVTTFILNRQSESSRRRERELSPDGASVAVVRKAAGAVGLNVDTEQAARLGALTHHASGVAGGPVVALVSRGRGPVRAGLATALGMWLVVDEGMNWLLGSTPPPTAYPLITHGRALVGHISYGLAAGALVGGMRALIGRTTASSR